MRAFKFVSRVPKYDIIFLVCKGDVSSCRSVFLNRGNEGALEEKYGFISTAELVLTKHILYYHVFGLISATYLM